MRIIERVLMYTSAICIQDSVWTIYTIKKAQMLLWRHLQFLKLKRSCPASPGHPHARRFMTFAATCAHAHRSFCRKVVRCELTKLGAQCRKQGMQRMEAARTLQYSQFMSIWKWNRCWQKFGRRNINQRHMSLLQELLPSWLVECYRKHLVSGTQSGADQTICSSLSLWFGTV
jgi:hypothetical protein